MRNKFLVAVLVLAGCATNGNKVELIDGFNPPAPGASSIQFIIPPIRNIPPGADETFCTYLDYRADKDMDIVDYQGYQSKIAAHHELLYAVDNKEPSGTHICNEDDMINARYLAGGGEESPPLQLPEGIVIRLPAHTQIMIQTHWINATDSAVDGQAAFNVHVEDPSPDHITSQLFTVATTQLTLPVGAGTGHAECTVQRDMSFFLMGGHEHEWGTHVRMTVTPSGGQPTMIYDTPWEASYQFNPPRNSYTKDAPFQMHAGDKLSVDCDYDNTTGATLQFPKEMCVGFGYWFPSGSTPEIDCVDGQWPTN